MAASGYQPAIGLLPMHDMTYLVAHSTDRATMFKSVQRNGYAAGQFGIHYRDQNTNRPPRFSQWPTLVIADGQGIKDNGASTNGSYTTPATGGNPNLWDIAHSPSVGYMAYLLTGRFYFMEEVQFASITNGLLMIDWARAGGGIPGYMNAPGYTGASCVLVPLTDAFQTRSSAWGLRTLAQAVCVTPSNDALYSDLLASMEDNCRYFNEKYSGQTTNRGIIKPGESYNGTTRDIAVWQQDFVTAAWGYAKAMGLPLSVQGQSRIDAFFAWKAKSIIFRLGPSSGFWYINANAYTARVSPSNFPDYVGGTGPWHATDAECYADTYPSVGQYMSTTEGVLGFDYGAPSEAVKAMWANIQPAISYAVRFGVVGALAAYNRMVGASNWASFASEQTGRPVWSVVPASGLMPAWMSGVSVGQWVDIPGTANPPAGLNMNAYCDMTIRPSDSTILAVASGGHSDGSSNGAAKVTLEADSPAWVTLRNSSTPTADVLYYGDGTPTSRHTYYHTHYIASRNAVLLAGCRFGFGGGTPTGPGMDLFDLDTNTYEPRYTWPDIIGGGYGVVQDGEGNIWTQSGYKFTVSTATWSKPGNGGLPRGPATYDSVRNRFFALQWGDGQGYDPQLGVQAFELDPTNGNGAAITFNASAAYSQFTTDGPAYAGMAFSPVDGKFYFLHPGRMGQFYVITPNGGTVWDMATYSASAGTAPTSSGILCKRLLWVQKLGGFVVQGNASSNMKFLRMV
jgi:hypothetical protein